MLREWEIEQARLMGDPVTITPVVLIKKASSKPPKRVDIKPNVIQNEGEFRLEALEIQDIPTSYALVFEKGISIHVRPFLKGPSSVFPRILFLFKWYAINPVQVLFSSCKGSPFTTIEIVMKDQREARALFWVFSEGTGCILIRQPV
ncbi:MAG: hypothetical protein ACMUIU_17545 [bacterium]